MKVLIIRAYPSLIELSKNTYNQQEIGLASAFLSLGHQVGIVYYGGDIHMDKEYATPHGAIRIYYRKARVLLKRISLFEDFHDLKDEYDLLISNEYDQLETVKTLREYAEKTVIYHGPYYSPFNKRYNLANKIFDHLFLEKMQRKAPAIVTKSRLAKEFLEGKGLTVQADVGVGLNNAQLMVPEKSVNPMEGRLDENNIHLLYVGRLEPRRNILFLLDVLEKLVKRNPRYRLVIVGMGEEKYVSDVFRTISEKKLEPYIIYEKSLAQNQLPYLYKTCDAFLLPTEYEIWGMVLMEAMRFNLPILTTYNGGASSLIAPGVNGHILELDAAMWVQAVLERKLDMPQLTQYNERTLAEKCNWEKIAKKIVEIYQNNCLR